MRFLILGGTRFLGRHLVEAALARAHQVTLFNRQRTNPGLFPGVEKLRGDRHGALQALHHGSWDAVIDTSGQSSATVRATAQLLAGRVDHYTFVSSASVYSNFATVGLDESAPLETLPNGTNEDETDSATYGARKALCEQAAEAALSGRVLKVRPGIIVGPHDPTGRFLYWVLRAAAGPQLLAPGNPEAPVQLIDARDLSQWLIRMAEAGTTGTYNATGPSSLMTFGQMLEQCLLASRSQTRITWVDAAFLLERGVQPFSDLPFWLPMATHQGFFAVNSRRAIAAGLTCRPLTETAADTLRWSRDAAIQLQVGLTPDRERALLRLWEQQLGTGGNQVRVS